jgi:hypothetical protein
MRNANKLSKEDRKGIALRNCVLVVVNPGTWLALVQARAKKRQRLMRKTDPPGGPYAK